MINIDKIIAQAIEKDASDIHLMSGLKPMARVSRALIELEGTEIIKDKQEFYYPYSGETFKISLFEKK